MSSSGSAFSEKDSEGMKTNISTTSTSAQEAVVLQGYYENEVLDDVTCAYSAARQILQTREPL